MSRRRPRLFAVIGLFLAVAAGQGLAQDGRLASPLLSIETTAGETLVTGIVLGHATGEVAARIDVLRTGPSGSVGSRQGRTVSVAPDSRETIATLRLSLDAGSELDIVMVLEAEGRELARMHQTLSHHR